MARNAIRHPLTRVEHSRSILGISPIEENVNPAQERIHRAALQLFAEKGDTRITVSELAQAAGIARGTIYNNLESPDTLFESVATQLTAEMHQRVALSSAGISDPVLRMACGLRFFVRRAHEEPSWGRFLTRFSFSHASLKGMWGGQPMTDVMDAMTRGRYSIRPEQITSAIALLAGAGLAAMFLVQDGHRTWREAGTDAAELVLRALGIPPDEARKLAAAELPPLLPLP